MDGVRVFRLVALVGAAALLGAGAWLAQSGLQERAGERRQLAQVQAGVNQARGLLAEVDKREHWARTVDETAKQAERMGFDPAQWGERRLRRALAAVSRNEATQYLKGLEGGGPGGGIFAVDVFEIAVVSGNAGLFTPPAAGDRGLAFAVGGTLHFRAADREITVAAP